jgi:hypothetical protein
MTLKMKLSQAERPMQTDPFKQIRLDESHIQRGASGQAPRTPKPDIIPKGQSKKAEPPEENTRR